PPSWQRESLQRISPIKGRIQEIRHGADQGYNRQKSPWHSGDHGQDESPSVHVPTPWSRMKYSKYSKPSSPVTLCVATAIGSFSALSHAVTFWADLHEYNRSTASERCLWPHKSNGRVRQRPWT